MAKRRGSRASRGKVSNATAEDFGSGVEVVDPAERIRLAVVEWMDELEEMKRVEAEEREKWVAALREAQAARQKRMDESRHARKQNKKRLIQQRRDALVKTVSKASNRPVVACKPTGLPVHGPGTLKVRDGKVLRVYYPEDEAMKKSIQEVIDRVRDRAARQATLDQGTGE